MPNSTNNIVLAYIGLGSNLNNPVAQLKRALQSLRSLKNCIFICNSTFHQSIAIGPGKQQDYLNAVAKISTTLHPCQLLEKLQAIEDSQQRTRSIRWGARTIDLDILLYGNEIINSADLIIPHPQLNKRPFVIEPLLEIEPDLELPTGESLVSFSASFQLT